VLWNFEHFSGRNRFVDGRTLIEALRQEPIPENWDPASGGAYIRELWAPNAAEANDLNKLLLDNVEVRAAAFEEAATIVEQMAAEEAAAKSQRMSPLALPNLIAMRFRQIARKLRARHSP